MISVIFAIPDDLVSGQLLTNPAVKRKYPPYTNDAFPLPMIVKLGAAFRKNLFASSPTQCHSTSRHWWHKLFIFCDGIMGYLMLRLWSQFQRSGAPQWLASPWLWLYWMVRMTKRHLQPSTHSPPLPAPWAVRARLKVTRGWGYQLAPENQWPERYPCGETGRVKSCDQGSNMTGHTAKPWGCVLRNN